MNGSSSSDDDGSEAGEVVHSSSEDEKFDEEYNEEYQVRKSKNGNRHNNPNKRSTRNSTVRDRGQLLDANSDISDSTNSDDDSAGSRRNRSRGRKSSSSSRRENKKLRKEMHRLQDGYKKLRECVLVLKNTQKSEILEMQSIKKANMELQASNAELRASNAELYASDAELRVSNAELHTSFQREKKEMHALVSGLHGFQNNNSRNHDEDNINKLYDPNTTIDELVSLMNTDQQNDKNDDKRRRSSRHHPRFKMNENLEDSELEDTEYNDDDKFLDEEEDGGRLLSSGDLARIKSRAFSHNNRDIAGGCVDEDDKIYLSHDIFSTLMISRYECSSRLIPCIFSLAVCIFQLSAFSLIFASVFDRDADDGNVFGFPANVDTSTRAAEVIAIIIAVATEEDTRAAIILWYDGYTGTKYVTGEYVDRRVSFTNWCISVLFRAAVGLFDIVMAFLLIMRSEEVVDLLLNFTAVQFVSSLDDVAFHVASDGFVGLVNQIETNVVESTYYYFPKIDDSRKLRDDWKIWRSEAFRIFLYLMVLLPLIINWGVVVDEQRHGQYSCKKIFVQFGDDVRHDLGALSGEYQFKPNVRPLSGENQSVHDVLRRSHYFLSNTENTTTYAIFTYCKKEKVWALIYSPNVSYSDVSDPCINKTWTVRSSVDRSYSYDIKKAASSNWFVKNKEGKEIIMDQMYLFCSDPTKKFCGTNVKEEAKVKKKKKKNSIRTSDTICDCKDGWYGLRCDFREPCPTIAIDSSFDPFIGYRKWSETFTRLNSTNNDDNASSFVDFFNHPVYIANATIAGHTQFEIIIFTGRRWILTSTAFFRGQDELVNTTEERLINYLEEKFHPMWSNYTIEFVSEPVDVDTSTDSVTPVGLKWFRASADSTLKSAEFSQEIPTTLLCATCDDDSNKCQSGGTCGTGKRCECANGASGVLCQILPLEDGFCDLFFNKVTYSFDGGDCCQASCVSDTFKCGQHEDRPGYKGYCNCVDRRYSQCKDRRDTCWMQNSDSIVGETETSESGAAIALSSDARIIAVGEPGSDRVRVFQIDGFNWIPLGEILEGDPGSRFGEFIAMSGNGKKVVVASGLDGLVTVFEFLNNGWKKIEEEKISKVAAKANSVPDANANVPTAQPTTLFPTFEQPTAVSTVSTFSPSDMTVEQNETGPTWEDSLLFTDQFMAGPTFEDSNAEFSVAPTSENNSYPTDFNDPWESSTTAPQSAEPDCETQLVSYLALSYDGKILYIGATSCENQGILFRCEFNTTDNSYFALSPSNVTPSSESVYIIGSKSSFSVSSSGHISSYGGIFYDDYNSGNVVVQVAESLGTFRQLGQRIPGAHGLLSGDGRVLVVSSMEEYAQFETYYWGQNQFKNEREWIKRGSKINGTVEAISFDGSTLAATRDDSLVYTYLWNGTEWAYQHNTTAGDGSANVVLAGGKNGEKPSMAVGLPMDNSMVQSFGQTHLYQFKENDELGKCERRNLIVRLELTTDASPHETTWVIRDYRSKKTLLAGGPYDQNETYSILVDETLALHNTSTCAEFVIYDLGGNGICCNKGFGSYSLYFGGVLETIGGEFAWSESHRFGDCRSTCAEGRSQFSVSLTTDWSPKETTWDFVDKNSGIVLLTGGPYTFEETEYALETCLPSSVCGTFTIYDSEGNGICCYSGEGGEYSISFNGTLISKKGIFKEFESTVIGNCSLQAETYNSKQLTSLSINTTSNVVPIGKRWVIYTIGLTNTTHSNQSMIVDLDLRDCYLFEVLDFGTTGATSPGGYSLFLDDEMVLSGDNFLPGNAYLIGACANVTSYFKTTSSDSITCSDAFLNSCRAPALCAKSSISLEPVGENIIGTSLRDGFWTSDGAYELAFGNDCDVICTGACNSISIPSPQCEANEMVLRLQLHVTKSYWETAWNVSNQAGENLLLGSFMADTATDTNTVLNGRVCIPKDYCSIFNIKGSPFEYFLYLDGEYFASDTAKVDYFAIAAERICPHGMQIPTNEGLTSSDSFQWKSNQLCDTVIQMLSVEEIYNDSTESGAVDYVPKCGATRGSVAPGVWFKVIGTGSTLSARLCKSSFDTQISVFMGPCDSATCVEGNDDSSICDDRRTSLVMWDSLQDSAYFIYVHGYAEEYGNFSIVVSEVVRPKNDVCDEATDLNFQGTVVSFSDTTNFASHDDVDLCDDIEPSPSNGVWYSVIGKGTNLLASLCDSTNSSYSYYSEISIFSGSCAQLICMEGNVLSCGASSNHNQVIWNATAATTYYILVHGRRGSSGNFTLAVGEAPGIPKNDLCLDAEKLELDEAKNSSTEWATLDRNVPGCKGAYKPLGPGVWYFIMGTGNVITAALCDNTTNFDSQLAVFSGSCDHLSCVAGNDDACGVKSSVQWFSDYNTTYYLLVYGYGTDRGDFAIKATR